MAHVEDRWFRTESVDDKQVLAPKPGHGKGMRYRVRYLGPDGRERSESSPDKRKREAQAFLNKVQADILRGQYVDPVAGRTTFAQYASGWMEGITSSQNTRDRHERQLRLHVLPIIGGIRMSDIAPTTVRAWQRHLQDAGVSVGYRRLLFHDLSVIFNAAVDDRVITTNPCSAKTVKPPRSRPSKVTPWPLEHLHAVRAGIRPRYAITVDLGAGCGLRQGEIFGFSPDDIDDKKRIIRVVRQLKVVRGQLVFAPPKTGKTRDVPLPDSVRERIDAHQVSSEPVAVTLPWETLDGRPTTVSLLLTREAEAAVLSSTFNGCVWKPALRKAGVLPTRENGMHVLRHTYASVLLDAGESVKALSLYLGHTDPGFTLRVYTHLLPASEDGTRRAIDRALNQDHGLGTA